jgi:hypothetical protein
MLENTFIFLKIIQANLHHFFHSTNSTLFTIQGFRKIASWKYVFLKKSYCFERPPLPLGNHLSHRRFTQATARELITPPIILKTPASKLSAICDNTALKLNVENIPIIK